MVICTILYSANYLSITEVMSCENEVKRELLKIKGDGGSKTKVRGTV